MLQEVSGQNLKVNSIWFPLQLCCIKCSPTLIVDVGMCVALFNNLLGVCWCFIV